MNRRIENSDIMQLEETSILLNVITCTLVHANSSMERGVKRESVVATRRYAQKEVNTNELNPILSYGLASVQCIQLLYYVCVCVSLLKLE